MTAAGASAAGASAGQDAVPESSLAVPAAGAAPAGRVPRRWVCAIALANLGLFMAYFGPLGVLLPDQVQAVAGPAHRIVAFSWVTGLGAVTAMITNPVAGALSDRTLGRFGRRRPWALGGSLVAALALLLVGRLHSLPGIAAAWCLAQVGINAMQAGLAAGVPDRVPVSQRGSVSAWIGIAQTVAVAIAAIIVTRLASGYSGYLLLGAAVVALALPYVLGTPDQPLSPADRPEFGWPAFLRSFWMSPVRYPDFGWAWLTRFAMVLGNAMAVVYLLYFLRHLGLGRQFPGHQAEDGLVILLTVYTITVVATTVAAGKISDRSGRRRRSVAVAGGVMALAAVLLAIRPNAPVLLTSAAILGIGFGMYLSVDQALITQVLPSAATRAKDLGVVSVASSAGQAIAPAIAAPVVTYLGGFATLYLCVAAIVALGSASVWQIRSVA